MAVQPTVSAPFLPPKVGVYAYTFRAPGEQSRVHLRVEADGSGLLLTNASRRYELDATAVYMAYLFLEGVPVPAAARALSERFQLSASRARQEFASFTEKMEILVRPDDACPICALEDSLSYTMPFSSRPTAPLRMDLALTYRCSNDCHHCYNARPRQGPELSTAEWKKVLDLTWQARIPHVVFTGGEPTLRPDLVELVAHAQANGQIAGLNTNGRRLKDPAYVAALVDAGLDHVQITLESHDPAVHDRMVARSGAWQETVDGIRAALQSRLFVMTNTTLLEDNAPYLQDTLTFLTDLGVPTFGLNALIYSGRGLNVGRGLAESQLPPLLEMARAHVERSGQRLIWYTPTQYCHFDPLQLELGVKGCTAALSNMCVEPDGAVLPCQSYYTPLGNLLRDPWDKIWNHELAVSLRERRGLPAECQSCTFLAECGGGCPLARTAGQSAPPVCIQPIPPAF